MGHQKSFRENLTIFSAAGILTKLRCLRFTDLRMIALYALIVHSSSAASRRGPRGGRAHSDTNVSLQGGEREDEKTDIHLQYWRSADQQQLYPRPRGPKRRSTSPGQTATKGEHRAKAGTPLISPQRPFHKFASPPQMGV